MCGLTELLLLHLDADALVKYKPVCYCSLRSPSRTATVPTTPASLDHNPTATASDRQEPTVCTPAFECATVYFVKGCVCFTDNCIIGSMFNDRQDESNSANGCMMCVRVKGAATQWMCMMVEGNVTEQCKRQKAAEELCDVMND